MNAALPPGQRQTELFPRFGITKFARRFPKETSSFQLQILGAVEQELNIANPLACLPRIEQVSDFHCVTTWSRCSLRWGGVRFADFYQQVLLLQARPQANAHFFILRGQDGARTSMLLQDLLAPDVLLADTLEGRPLGIEHGAPLRLVAPAQYGYKSVKHLARIELCLDDTSFRPSVFRFMDHPRARVALEERGRGAPGWLLRYLYRPMVPVTTTLFANAMAEYHRDQRRV